MIHIPSVRFALLPPLLSVIHAVTSVFHDFLGNFHDQQGLHRATRMQTSMIHNPSDLQGLTEGAANALSYAIATEQHGEAGGQDGSREELDSRSYPVRLSL